MWKNEKPSRREGLVAVCNQLLIKITEAPCMYDQDRPLSV